ncbi:group II intron maturase-specific domain-containing protein [Sunxiuqinia dokdonensis]|uniref:group II intron maturase-specific domain-containing protein n=1 Tax=Sunxiuqinia dokdonensis TaxID=1409788 RepID=UPI0009E8D1EB|nr:group II intron maturase-specific domain-containing protein [Sunxiuqinia dokdonensis]
MNQNNPLKRGVYLSIEKFKEVSQGWLNYFRMASIHGKLEELAGWLRNRLLDKSFKFNVG